MRAWWSKYYSRPLKDPLLDSYTLEELLYEYHDIVYRKEAEEKEVKELNDKIEDDKLDATLKWAEEDERLEAELAAQEELLSKGLGPQPEPHLSRGQSQSDVNENRTGNQLAERAGQSDLPEEINTDFRDL
jgi:hypothetical protein